MLHRRRFQHTAVSAQYGGAVVGAFIMGVMNNGMSIMGLDVFLQSVAKGMNKCCLQWHYRHVLEIRKSRLG